MRLQSTRSIAFASVTVPTVERAFAPMRSWSTMIAVGIPSSTSTSGLAIDGMKPWTNALYVSLMSRCDSAAIVPKTSDDLPDPETPVNTVSRRFGISTVMFLRLFSRAPWTRIRSWLSAGCEPTSEPEAELHDKLVRVVHRFQRAELLLHRDVVHRKRRNHRFDG